MAHSLFVPPAGLTLDALIAESARLCGVSAAARVRSAELLRTIDADGGRHASARAPVVTAGLLPPARGIAPLRPRPVAPRPPDHSRIAP